MSVNAPIASGNIKNQVIQNSWNYILENFHKFTEANKIKVVLAIISKDMPTKLEGGLSFTNMPVVKEDGKPQEINIGS